MDVLHNTISIDESKINSRIYYGNIRIDSEILLYITHWEIPMHNKPYLMYIKGETYERLVSKYIIYNCYGNQVAIVYGNHSNAQYYLRIKNNNEITARYFKYNNKPYYEICYIHSLKIEYTIEYDLYGNVTKITYCACQYNNFDNPKTDILKYLKNVIGYHPDHLWHYVYI